MDPFHAFTRNMTAVKDYCYISQKMNIFHLFTKQKISTKMEVKNRAHRFVLTDVRILFKQNIQNYEHKLFKFI